LNLSSVQAMAILSEVVEFLKENFCDFFTKTQDLNKYLLNKSILIKDNGVYMTNKEYEQLFFIDKILEILNNMNIPI
jgi:hypothetical protein